MGLFIMFFGEGIAVAMFCVMRFDCSLICIVTTKLLRGLSEYYDLLHSFGVLWRDANKDNSLCQNRDIVFQRCEINIRNCVQGVYELKIFLFQLKSTELIWCSCKWGLTPCGSLQLKALSKGGLIDFSMCIRLQRSGWILSCWLR